MDAKQALAAADPEQVRLMAERVILVDSNDAVQGHMSKADSHMVGNDLPLHRAFSVFLFNTKGEMLLQQRASTKVTFPTYWTNTVCSHPLFTSRELGQDDNGDEVTGTKRAAVRKLSHELGITPGSVTTDDLHFLTRIHYRAECDDHIWGEHELDYVYFVQKDVELRPEPNEVDAVRYVTKEQLSALYDDAAKVGSTTRITPWFRHIVDNFALRWWSTLLEQGTAGLSKHVDRNSIHRMGSCKAQ